jgi:predicted deacylase
LAHNGFEFAGIHVAPGERSYTPLPVTKLLNGAILNIPVHVIHGAEPGPVLGITCAVHGAEYVPVRIAREFVSRLNPSQVKGTLVVIPICNPLSFAKGTRISPDEDDVDFANLNRVFPGRRENPVFGATVTPFGSHSYRSNGGCDFGEHFAEDRAHH